MLFEAALKIIGFSDVKPSGMSFRLENVNVVHDIRPAYARWAPARHLAKAFGYRRRRRVASPRGLAALPNQGRCRALAAAPRPFSLRFASVVEPKGRCGATGVAAGAASHPRGDATKQKNRLKGGVFVASPRGFEPRSRPMLFSWNDLR
ncbi:MAG: hypothetical protein RL091_3075 [Verrucomicrobiota bacterium]